MFLKIIMGNQKKMLNYREKQLGHRPKMVHREHLLRNVSLMDSFTFFQVCVKTLADGQKNNETFKKNFSLKMMVDKICSILSVKNAFSSVS